MQARTLIAICLIAAVSAGTNRKGLKFLEENKDKDHVVTLPSGLQYKVLRKGHGLFHPAHNAPCECHYEGTLIDGTEFDSSYARGTPTTFAPNQVIKGWTEAMQLMVEGDKWEMYIPSELGYGDSGSPPKIGGGDVLIFRMEIITIKGDKVPAITCEPMTLHGCDEKETKYSTKMLEKFGEDIPALKDELDRLKKIAGGKMKPSLQVWMTRRLNILTKILNAKDQSGPNRGPRVMDEL